MVINKKFLSFILIMVILAGTLPITATAANIIATPTSSKVFVNGEQISFDAYTINGSNYFKLRDIAIDVKGTKGQFDVIWDSAKNAINLISNKPYTSIGGEMSKGDGKSKTPVINKSPIYKDGALIELTAYTIKSNNYFMLRDIGEAFDIGVSWDDATKSIYIDTNKVNSSVYLKKTDVASQAARYIPVEKVGTYNKNIINEELKAKPSTLPEASNSSIPYWTGFASENKIFKNFKDGRWDEATDGSTYFYEQQIKFIADEGFNCARMLYSLSFLSNPKNILEVNEAELEQLDELISWGMKYNVHIMLSFTGLPGKAGTSVKEENVGSNDELFRNPELADTFNKYMTMLARRYADIPDRNLSFELLAEPAVPEGNMDTYVKVLTPIVKSMWTVSPGRILIIAELYRQVPEQMAALGCCLSLHNHIFTVDGSRLENIDYKPSWPMEYLPGFFNPNGDQTLTLQSETEFKAGTVSMYVDQGNIQIIADSKVLLPSSNGKTGWVEVQIPKGTKKIGIKDAGTYVHFSAVKIKSDGKDVVTLVIHDLYTGSENNAMPTILIKDDGTTQNIDNPQKLLNAEFFTKEYLRKFIDCAKKYNVGFLETEIGTDTRDLNKEEYKAYHGEWLKALKDNNIPWMYNCLHNVLTPYSVFRKDIDIQFAAGYTDVTKIDGTPLVKNTGIIEILREYK